MANEQTYNITNETSYAPPCTGSRPIKPVEIATWSVFMLLSLIGNSFIVAVFYRNRTLRTPVHYFIVNMAVSDLIIPVVVLPWKIAEAYQGGVWLVDGLPGSILCKFVWVAWAVSITVSIFSMIAIAAERFHGVLFAMKPALISGKTCHLIIVLTWVSSVTFWAYVFHRAGLVWGDTGFGCVKNTKSLSTAVMEKLWKISFLSLCFLSTVLLTVLYSIIIIFLYRQKKNSYMASEIKKMRRKENQKIARMLVIVVLVFYAVSMPYNVMTLVHLLKPNTRYSCLFIWFAEIFPPTSYTAINPIVYYTCNENYHQGFRELLCCLWPFNSNCNHCFQLARSSRIENNASNIEQVNNSNEIFEFQNM